MRPKMTSDLTLVTAFDAKYINRLRCTWPTWMRFRPWLRDIPVVLIYDASFDLECVDLSFLDHHRAIRLLPWTMPEAATQRERMLTSLVQVPATEVETSWYLKLDADTYATGHTEWLCDEWFQPIPDRGTPAYVASPWGYTKPADTIAKLDDWADGVQELSVYPRLDLPIAEGSEIARHPRMASWVFFGNTAWTRRVAALAPGRLPCPSQDTYLSYCATRLQSPVRRIRMAKYGWRHTSRLSTLKNACNTALAAGNARNAN